MKDKFKSNTLIAGALTSGLSGAIHAATVQINLTGNTISSNGENNLVADITGDGNSDVTFSATSVYSGLVYINIDGGKVGGYNQLASSTTGNGAVVSFTKALADAQFRAGGYGVPATGGRSSSFDIKYLNPVTFTDQRINGGIPTDGFLEVNMIAAGSNASSVTLTRFVFDDSSTARPTGVDTGTTYTEFVPETSSLTLLALGAGGLMLRRKRDKTA